MIRGVGWGGDSSRWLLATAFFQRVFDGVGDGFADDFLLWSVPEVDVSSFVPVGEVFGAFGGITYALIEVVDEDV